MHTLTLTTIVNPDHTLTVAVPADIPPGPHQVVVVIQEELSPPKRGPAIANWPTIDAALVDPSNTFRREDMYGDDGR